MTSKMDTGFFAIYGLRVCVLGSVFIVSLSLYYRLTGNTRVHDVCWLDSLPEEVSRDLYVSYFS